MCVRWGYPERDGGAKVGLGQAYYEVRISHFIFLVATVLNSLKERQQQFRNNFLLFVPSFAFNGMETILLLMSTSKALLRDINNVNILTPNSASHIPDLCTCGIEKLSLYQYVDTIPIELFWTNKDDVHPPHICLSY